MGTEKFLASLAGTGKRYYPLQAKADGSTLHFQAKGPNSNLGHSHRDYGIAVDITAPPELVKWVSEQKGKVKSFASNSVTYVSMRGRVRDGLVHVQAVGTKLNKGYGTSFSFTDEPLASFLNKILTPVVPEIEEEPSCEEEEEETNAKLT